MSDPNARFLSPAAAFAAQQEQETRLMLAVEKAFENLLSQARQGIATYSLSQSALRNSWESSIDAMVESLGVTGAAGEELKRSLRDFDISEEIYESADSLMKFGLSVGASSKQSGEALELIMGSQSLVASGARELWNKIKDWAQPRRRNLRTKARRIVRTSYTGFAGNLTQAWLRQNGYFTKMWVTRHDNDVRTTHRSADGQVVPVDAKFQVGSAWLAYPGERNGPAGETINCRCVIISGDSKY